MVNVCQQICNYHRCSNSTDDINVLISPTTLTFPSLCHWPQVLPCLAALPQLSNVGRGGSLGTPLLISVRYHVNPYETCITESEDAIPVIPKPAMGQTFR